MTLFSQLPCHLSTTSTPGDSHSSDSLRTGHLSPTGEDRSSKAATRAPQKLVEVSKHTEQHLVCSFASMDNKDRCKLADSFGLTKVAVTKTPDLGKIMTAQYLKRIKTNDQALARIQALNLDALGPLNELLELLNREDEEEEVPDLHE